jgi:uncharacterized protein (TIGR03083 family)
MDSTRLDSARPAPARPAPARPAPARLGPARLRECLAADEARLRGVAAAGDLGAAVPTCPDWTLGDLVEHVGLVYLDKVECMRTGRAAEWPAEVEEPPLELLDTAYAALLAEFDARPPEAASYTWYDPDQTVGFNIRRMAQETVIHRVDAELAAGVPVTAIPDDLAVDGIDEVLERFLAFGAAGWPDMFGADLAEARGEAVLVSAGGHSWLVRMESSAVVVDPAPAGAPVAGRLGGDPQAVLRWLWRRADAEAVTYEGDPAALSRLHSLLRTATQ